MFNYLARIDMMVSIEIAQNIHESIFIIILWVYSRERIAQGECSNGSGRGALIWPNHLSSSMVIREDLPLPIFSVPRSHKFLLFEVTMKFSVLNL